MNKYLEKVSARLKSKHAHKMREMVRDELLEHAVHKVKEHHKKRKEEKGHEKSAIALTMYECPETGKTRWIAGNKSGPEGWTVKKKSYKKFEKKA